MFPPVFPIYLPFWVLSILEEGELQAHFGRAYTSYVRRVPRLFPN